MSPLHRGVAMGEHDWFVYIDSSLIASVLSRIDNQEMTDKDFEINSCYDFKNPKILGERVFRDRLKILQY